MKVTRTDTWAIRPPRHWCECGNDGGPCHPELDCICLVDCEVTWSAAVSYDAAAELGHVGALSFEAPFSEDDFTAEQLERMRGLLWEEYERQSEAPARLARSVVEAARVTTRRIADALSRPLEPDPLGAYRQIGALRAELESARLQLQRLADAAHAVLTTHKEAA